MANENFSPIKLNRIYIIAFIFSLFLMLACVRWQIVEASKFEEIQKSRIYTSEMDSLRGSIYSSDGSILALSEPRFDVYIWMKDVLFFEEKGYQTRDELLSKVAPLIDTTPDKLSEKIQENFEKNKVYWFKIADNIDSDAWEKLNNLKTDANPDRLLSGYTFQYTSQRVYPENNLASHIIGLTTQYKDKTLGQSGIELYWDGVLNPVKGFRVQEDNAIGQAIPTALLPTIEPQNGSSIYTTIDKKLQKIIQDKIKKGVEDYEAESGSIIVMDPKTGKILAMANYPDFDLNTREGKDENKGNISLSAPFETGSTGKVLTLAAAVDLGIADKDTIVLQDGHQGCEKIHRDLEPVCTWNKLPQAAMPLSDCLIRSDNLCFYHLAEKMQRRDFHKYLAGFGVGTPTGVDIAGESYGLLKSADLWNTGDVAAFSYGHGYLLNSLQSITAHATIANKGVRMKPFVVSKLVDSKGEETIYEPNQIQRVVSEESSQKVVDMMKMVYQNDIKDYEYWFHHLRNYDIASKSGSALIATAEGYTSDINASYVGFDASEDRSFIMLVKLEKPKGKETGENLSFYNVRPLWLETFDAIKDHLGVRAR